MIDKSKAQDVWKDAGKSVDFVILKLNRKDQEEEQAKMCDFVDRYQAILRSQRIRSAEGNLKASLGFSYEAWTYLFPNAPVPKELEPYKTMASGKYQMPKGIDGDIFLHIRANNEAIVYETVSQLMLFLKDFTTVIDETKGFRYFEGRAIVEFIDGTENPESQDAEEYGIIGDEDPFFINGSYAFAQKWQHDMDYWNDLKVEEQEKAIGRKKFSDLELEDDEKYANAHNVVSKVELDGEEQKIIRMNVPYANPALNEKGTYFIGYSRHWYITKMMLDRMLENGDFLLTFSEILHSNLFFIPSRTLLDKIADEELNA